MEPESYSQIPASFVIFITCVDNTRKHVWRNLHNKAPMGVVNCEIFFTFVLSRKRRILVKVFRFNLDWYARYNPILYRCGVLCQFISAKVFQNLYSNKPGSSTLSFCNHAKSGLGGANTYRHGENYSLLDSQRIR